MVKRLTFATAFAVMLFSFAAPASAAGPAYTLHTLADSSVAPGGQFTYWVEVQNLGDEDANGSETDMRVSLPPGITAVSAQGAAVVEAAFSQLACTAGDGSSPVAGASTVLCPYIGPLPTRAFQTALEYRIKVAVDGGVADPSVLTSSFEASGGGAPTVGTVDPTTITGAPPVFGLDAFDGQVASDPAGDPFTQAGGTPYDASTQIDFSLGPDSNPLVDDAQPVEPTKDVSVDLPPGFTGIPGDLPQCTGAQLFGDGQIPTCPVESQVGTTLIHTYSRSNVVFPVPSFGISIGPVAVFNMVPPPGTPARFGFNYFGTIVTLDARLRSGSDYGLSVVARNVSEGLPLAGTSLSFWGVPAAPAHDADRACPGEPDPWRGGGSCASAADPATGAFLRNPTSCTGPLTTEVAIDSWFNPGTFTADGKPDLADPSWKQGSFVSHNPPGYPANPNDLSTPWGAPQGVTGCAQVPFNPSIAVQPTSNEADSPTGLEVDLHLPQTSDPNAISEADLKKAVLYLPEGISINPSSADGLGACSSAQIALDSDGPASCPENAKVGTISIDTPLLSDPLDGSVYLAKQKDNPNNNLLTLYIVASERGANLKLPGRITADPDTGQLTAVFDNQPQLPFETLHFRLFSGPRASLRTPPACGTYTTQAELTPWSHQGTEGEEGTPSANLESSFQITKGPSGSPCPPQPAGFDPGLNAGTENPLAGAYSPFDLRLTRDDATQELGGITATLPEGLLAKLAGIPYCPDAALGAVSGDEGTGLAQLADPSCPAASQIGRVTVGAGAGSNPFFTEKGRVYLAGPYNGAPLSVAVVAPAVAGPFDLGSVVVRNALRIDPTTTQATAVSDPFPTILHGIPLDLRDVRVELNRSEFTLNPTSCDPMAVEAIVSSPLGAVATPSDRFQVGNCGSLGFRPKLSLRFSGKTKRTGNPALHAILTMPNGGANLAKTRVTLPKGELIDNAHINNPCTRVQFNAGACPKSSILGHARAFSPLLDQPLEGPVYFRSNGGERELPDLVVDLNGQIHVVLVGFIDSKGERIRGTFAQVPDAPASKFTLNLFGGKRGLLENGHNLCRAKSRALVQFDGQNGKVRDYEPLLKVKCGGTRHKR